MAYGFEPFILSSSGLIYALQPLSWKRSPVCTFDTLC